MQITYKEDKKIDVKQLEGLFLSLNWESGNYPNRLAKGMENSTYVITAWDKDQLVGLVRAMSDDSTIAIIHYVLVHPKYRGFGIGGKLMDILMTKLSDVLYVEVLASEEKSISFYEKYGIVRNEKYTALKRNNMDKLIDF